MSEMLVNSDFKTSSGFDRKGGLSRSPRTRRQAYRQPRRTTNRLARRADRLPHARTELHPGGVSELGGSQTGYPAIVSEFELNSVAGSEKEVASVYGSPTSGS